MKSGINLGQVDLSSEVPPGRGIYWPRAVLCQVSLTFGQSLDQADLWSDVSSCRGHLVAKTGTNLGPVDLNSDVPAVEASSGQEWY